MENNIEQKIDDLAASVKDGFDAVGVRLDKLENKVDSLDTRVKTLPDKDYLDDKLADLGGSLIVKLRREDAKVDFIIELLRKRNLLTDVDIEQIRSQFEVFPRLN